MSLDTKFSKLILVNASLATQSLNLADMSPKIDDIKPPCYRNERYTIYPLSFTML